jgi:hypothetical protein
MAENIARDGWEENAKTSSESSAEVFREAETIWDWDY